MAALWNRRMLPLTLAIAVACGSGGVDSGTGTDDDGACGDVTTHTVTVRGDVQDASGAAVQDAEVRLEERNWEPGILAEGTTDDTGRYELTAEITSVEDCWATALDYWVVVTDGELTVEDDLNQPLFNAIDDGSLDVDVATIVLE